ncbi:MAG: hypothetical protein Q9161_009087 [Pseudevernia consocians]
MVWLHDPSMISWESTLSAIRWCSVDWLRKSTAPEIYNVDEILPSLFDKAKNPVDLTVVSDPHRTWFSSLWTLQEACLRPSMVIVNYNWDPLVDDRGTYILLDNLLGVSHTKDSYKWVDTCSESLIVNELDEAWFDKAVAPIYGKASVRPLGAQQLYDLYHGDHGTGLITQPSQAGILATGSHRHCQDNADRPRSIQSVLGLTGWDQDSTAHKNSTFVLGLYPLPFVRAARQSIGARFFGCDMRLTPGDYNGLKDTWRAGSMMCFTAPGDPIRLTSLPYTHCAPESGNTDNSATRTWTINADGSVRIRRAAVLASHEGVMMYSDTTHLAASFIPWKEIKINVRTVRLLLKTANNQGRIDVFDCDDIRTFLQEQPSEIQTYLVATNSVIPHHPGDDNGPTHHGLVLQGIDNKCLRKIGTYMISGYKEVSSFPSTQEVDWVVL